MNACLLIDFGSTFTKLTAVDLTNERILGTFQSETTVNSNIMDGYQLAKEGLLNKMDSPGLTFDFQLACSSAKGGFKMVAIGLTHSLTAEAAKRVALGAGTRILKVYSYGLKPDDLEEIETLHPDIILLCGGTNGGNVKGIIQDASLLSQLTLDIPLVISGNEETYPEITTLFKGTRKKIYLTNNLMPQVNVLNPNPTRQILRNIFMEQIIDAKGLDVATEEIGQILMPTPTAVLQGASLLSKGTENTDGLGDLLVVDIGGATTDLHSIGNGKPHHSDIRMEGLPEPFEKRTVEGDLGMRYSALSLLESVTYQAFQPFTSLSPEEIRTQCQIRSKQTDMVAETTEDLDFDRVIAKLAIKTAFARHAGHYRREPTPTRVLLYQSGKDLRYFKYIIGTGGILVHTEHPKSILTACIGDKDDLILNPRNPKFLMDQSYILSAMGLLSEREPDISLRILKKYLVPL